ncbi:MAG: aldo/keto reductase [Syntrophomonadaceae bacterium]|nr:aldo/keto reductase [Syntrophomonadaceae bacterium]
MRKLDDCYQLNNGVQIPIVGFGTWQTPGGEVAVSSVKEAIKAGYRHIDTAAFYGNEESVGQAIKESGIDRKDLFITTKLWNSDHGYEAALKACAASLERLQLDYLDLYLIHWPNPIRFRDQFEKVNAETWKAMEKIYKDGKTKAIGISNYMPHHIEATLKNAETVPAVNQIRLYPGFIQEETVRYCKEKGILIQAYSPLGTGSMLEVKELRELTEKYHKTVAQICLRWSLQMGFLPLPKSVTPARIQENADIFDFELSEKDVQNLASMKNYGGAGFNPDTASF